MNKPFLFTFSVSVIILSTFSKREGKLQNGLMFFFPSLFCGVICLSLSSNIQQPGLEQSQLD